MWQSLKFQIPNAITCGNLLSGCFAIFFAVKGELLFAQYAIILAAILDFADGFVARLLNAQSPIGKDLDSLADVVTFGVAPAFMLWAVLDNLLVESNWAFLAFLLAAFAALRLAKFNNDPEQTDSFKGLPVPANALLISTLSVFLIDMSALFNQYQNWYIAIGLFGLFGCSWLMISDLPMLALKFKNFRWQKNKLRYLLLIWGLICFLFFPNYAWGLIILSYILISFIQKYFINNHEKFQS